jgi:hypothetical protein
VSPGLSPDDVLTVYWTKTTSRPDVTTTAQVLALLGFSPPLASVLRASWQAPDGLVSGARDRLVITLSGVVNTDVVATLVSTIRVSVLPGGGLRDASSTSQNASVINATASGSWGDASQPQFLSNTPAVFALDYGAQPGLGPGDAVLLRFNQPVAQVPVDTKSALDAVSGCCTCTSTCDAGLYPCEILTTHGVCCTCSPPQVLAWSPSTWASSYSGQWVDTLTLMVTLDEVPAMARTDPSVRSAVAVGALRVTVLPSGNLTSLDGTSAASNATALVTAGSWGDVVCDGGVLVYSHTALVVAFEPPANASYVPTSYTIQVASDARFSANDSSTRTLVVAPTSSAAGMVALPPPFSATALRYIVPGLDTGKPYHVRVSVSPPVLPVDLALSRSVPSVFR